MKYTLTIKDNDTGEIVREVETNAIIAGVTENDGAATIVVTECNDRELLGVIMSAKAGIKHCIKQNRLVGLLVAVAENEEKIED